MRGIKAEADATTTRAVPGTDAVQRPRAHGRHANVRRQPRTDPLRATGTAEWPGLAAAPDSPSIAATKNATSSTACSMIGVARQHVQHHAVRQAAGGRRHEQGLGGGSQARHDPRRDRPCLLRAIAVFNSARRLREVDVVTESSRPETFQCSKLAGPGCPTTPARLVVLNCTPGENVQR